jgi:hypothetical protein
MNNAASRNVALVGTSIGSMAYDEV